jgi:hypothetical protein
MSARTRLFASEVMEKQSPIWLHYQAAKALNPAIEQAARRALTAIGIHIGSAYQAVMPAARVDRSVVYDVKPPRLYVGPKDFRAIFFESGSRAHRIQATGTQLKMRRYKRTTKIVGFRKGKRYLAIPVGGKVLFRTTAHHPGFAAGHYLQRTGERSVPVIEQIVAQAFQAAFS